MLTKFLDTLVETLGLEKKSVKENCENVLNMIVDLKNENENLKLEKETIENHLNSKQD